MQLDEVALEVYKFLVVPLVLENGDGCEYAAARAFQAAEAFIAERKKYYREG